MAFLIKRFGVSNFYKNFLFTTVASYVVMICLNPPAGDSVIVSLVDENYGYFQHVIPGLYFTKYLIANLLGVTFLMIGISIPVMLSKDVRHETSKFLNGEIVDSKQQLQAVYKISVAIFLVCLPLIIWYVRETDGGPLLHMIGRMGDENYFVVERERSFKWLDPRWGLGSATILFYPLLFIRTTIFPIVLCILVLSLIKNFSRLKLLIAIPICLTISYYALYTMARAPFAALLLRLVIAIYLVKFFKDDRLFILALSSIVLVPIFITMPIYNNSFLETVVKIYNRLVVGPTNDVYNYISYCGNIIDFQYGATLLRPILQLFKLPNFYLENEIYKYLYPSGIFSGHNNAAYIANAYCDFGYMGVILVSIILGVIISCFHIFIVSKPKTLISCAWYGFLVYLFWVINFGSITSVFLANGLIVSTIVFSALSRVVYEKKY
ncbi:O-antigen polymerase [Polynucleobacter sp. AP-Titi-500A-B4]|uniref:O-antigen polymerase n=1 Tax=Polynucleobacter sp. AP-Titi-500A-B4 TaxID=2576923 RepID=UPI001BFE6CAB|nr:O-antigen polymerase [Polynucleobacter sp. AP-Titi-500A-B4]QWE12828.1 oligosaccharide repeat unit polymerase [Polynucleobacter sp. AP-Titi-500A-B4]